MSLRMVEIIAPDTQRDSLDRTLDELDLEDIWREDLLEDKYRVRLIFDTGDVEPATDVLKQRFSSVSGFRVIISEVEATIPRLEERDEKKQAEGDSTSSEDDGETSPSTGRVSREELYSEMHDASRLSPIYFVMLILSGLVASFGFYRQNLALIIAAMVIAPIIGPNIALAFATTIGDLSLFLRAFLSTFLGAVTVFSAVGVVGWFQPIEMSALKGMKAFYEVELWHIVLGFCAGVAGTLSFTRDYSTSLVGVAVAVALLPPMAASGLLLGSGHLAASATAMLLAINNVVSIIIASIVTFLIQGVLPMDWGEDRNSKRMTAIAVTLWFLLLVLLAGITYFVQF